MQIDVGHDGEVYQFLQSLKSNILNKKLTSRDEGCTFSESSLVTNLFPDR